MKNASENSLTRVSTMKEKPRPLSVNLHQERSSETEKHPSLHDTPRSGALQPTTSAAATPNSCPHSGYQLFPEFNCYKAFPAERRSWNEAREQCTRDGGDLMVLETEEEKKDVFIPLFNSVPLRSLVWAGVYIPPGGDTWMSVKGEPALSTWWAPGMPDGEATMKCALADATGLLWNLQCATNVSYICEITV